MKQIVVIGGGLGGLSAAIHARLGGAEVLLLEQGEQVGGKAGGIEIAGYTLDPGPSIIILPKIYEAVFAAAGRKMSDYLTFRRLPVISRIFMEGESPVDIPSDEQECMRLLESMNPADAKAMRSLLEKIAKVEPLLDKTVYKAPFLKPHQILNPGLLKFGMSFNPLREFKQLVDELVSLPLLRAFFYGFPSYGGQTYNAKSPGAFLIPYYMLRDGTYFPEGGVRAIPLAFRKLALELGVEIRTGSKVTSVEGESRMTAVVLDSGERIEADAFISNLDRFNFEKLRGATEEREPSFSYFTLHCGIRREVAGLDHHNLFIPKDFATGFEELYRDTRFPAEPIVYINSTTGQDPKAAPAGCTNLFAVITSPANVTGIDWQQETPEYIRRVKDVLAKGGLTWDEREQDFERIQTPLYFEKAHGNYRGSLYGLHESHRMWGMFPASNQDSRWKNLAFCGGSVQPGAGLPMVTLSGKFAAELVV